MVKSNQQITFRIVPEEDEESGYGWREFQCIEHPKFTVQEEIVEKIFAVNEWDENEFCIRHRGIFKSWKAATAKVQSLIAA